VYLHTESHISSFQDWSRAGNFDFLDQYLHSGCKKIIALLANIRGDLCVSVPVQHFQSTSQEKTNRTTQKEDTAPPHLPPCPVRQALRVFTSAVTLVLL